MQQAMEEGMRKAEAMRQEEARAIHESEQRLLSELIKSPMEAKLYEMGYGDQMKKALKEAQEKGYGANIKYSGWEGLRPEYQKLVNERENIWDESTLRTLGTQSGENLRFGRYHFGSEDLHLDEFDTTTHFFEHQWYDWFIGDVNKIKNRRPTY